jgi:hypothetical protein
VIVLLLVIDRSDYDHDYEQEHEGSFSCGYRNSFHPRSTDGQAGTPAATSPLPGRRCDVLAAPT